MTDESEKWLSDVAEWNARGTAKLREILWLLARVPTERFGEVIEYLHGVVWADGKGPNK
jgi:hypothetical protein